MEDTHRAEALFLSDLQPSQRPTPARVAAVIDACLRKWGPTECAAAAAAEYGEHPDTAPARMRWALRQVALAPAPRRQPKSIVAVSGELGT